MKSYFQIALLISYLPAFGAHGAAFQNLNFESGSLVPIPGDSFNRVYLDQAFPGWRGYVGGIQETAAFHNGMFLCCSSIAAWGGDSAPNLAIEGVFSVALHASSDPYGDPYDPRPADSSLTQTGLVPIETQSLLFRARIAGTGGSVTLGGETLSLMPVAVGSNYVLYGADIRAWAGQEAELRFTALGGEGPFGGTFFILDSIEFSTTPVPEPSTFALFAMAGIVGSFYWRRKR